MTERLRPILILIAVLWLVELADAVLPIALDAYGIRPRETAGLIGVLTAPFLHAGSGHLMANTVPLLVLGGLVRFGERRSFIAVTIEVVLVAGIGTWLIGRGGSVHVGASGLVFGYFGYVVARAIRERKIVTMLAACVAVALYGGMLFGLLPGQPGVSWEGHVCGLLGGVLAARGNGSEREQNA